MQFALAFILAYSDMTSPTIRLLLLYHLLTHESGTELSFMNTLIL